MSPASKPPFIGGPNYYGFWQIASCKDNNEYSVSTSTTQVIFIETWHNQDSQALLNNFETFIIEINRY